MYVYSNVLIAVYERERERGGEEGGLCGEEGGLCGEEGGLCGVEGG